MTETENQGQGLAPAPAQAIPQPAESGIASRVAALEADVGSFTARVRMLEAKTESWIVKHAGILAGTGGFLIGIAFTVLALKHPL